MSESSAHTNEAIARLFDRLAGLYEMQEGGGFKARAYRKGAQAIRDLPEQLTAMVAAGANLQKVPGIGKAIDGKVRELLDTGSVRTYDREAASASPFGACALGRSGHRGRLSTAAPRGDGRELGGGAAGRSRRRRGRMAAADRIAFPRRHSGLPP